MAETQAVAAVATAPVSIGTGSGVGNSEPGSKGAVGSGSRGSNRSHGSGKQRSRGSQGSRKRKSSRSSKSSADAPAAGTTSDATVQAPVIAVEAAPAVAGDAAPGEGEGAVPPMFKSKSAPTMIMPRIVINEPDAPAQKSPFGKFEHRTSSVSKMMILDDEDGPDIANHAGAGKDTKAADSSPPAPVSAVASEPSKPEKRRSSRSSRTSTGSGKAKTSAEEYFKNSQVIIDRSATSALLDEPETPREQSQYQPRGSSGDARDATVPAASPRGAAPRKSWDFSAADAAGPESRLVLQQAPPASPAPATRRQHAGSPHKRGGVKRPYDGEEEEFAPSDQGVFSSCGAFFTVNCSLQ